MRFLLRLAALLCFASPLQGLLEHDVCSFKTGISPSEMKHLKPCSGGLCRCKDATAICYRANLTYIPKLNDSFVMLDFSFNKLDFITNITFTNISVVNMKSLWLKHNNITSIVRNAFSNFTQLRLLDLRLNPFLQEDLKPALSSLRNTRLQCLALTEAELTHVDRYLFEGVRYLQGLVLTDSSFETFDFSVLAGLKDLKVLDVSYNGIYSVKRTYLPSLKTLKLNSNNFRSFPRLCRDTSNSSLNELDVSHNKLVTVKADDLKCLRSLTVLYLISNALNGIESNVFSSLSNVKELQLDHVFGRPEESPRVSAYALKSSSLVRLYAHELEIDFRTYVSSYAFKGCHNLNFLSLRYNRMESVDDGYLTGLLGELTSLQILRLDHCGLKFFPSVISKQLTNLKEIHLYSNKIKTINKGSFTGMKNLDLIIIASNGIHTIDSGAFPLPLQHQLRYINLCNNSFSCTCDILWFIKWMKRDSKKFGSYPKYYTCDNAHDPESTRLCDAPLSEILCTVPFTLYPVISSICGFTVICIVVTSVVYRWRWYIRYYIHMHRYNRRNHHVKDEEDMYTYDAFVLFCDDDLQFVTEQLMPEVEHDGGLSLCIHHRDFTPGKCIVDNIIDSLENSKKVVLLLSNSFSGSTWCEFELTLVQKRALEIQQSYLVVILLEELLPRSMTASLYALLQTTTYIMLPGEQEDRVLFWERVKESIRR